MPPGVVITGLTNTLVTAPAESEAVNYLALSEREKISPTLLSKYSIYYIFLKLKITTKAIQVYIPANMAGRFNRYNVATASIKMSTRNTWDWNPAMKCSIKPDRYRCLGPWGAFVGLMSL